MEPKVSIIVPVYNAAPDLARCIESVRLCGQYSESGVSGFRADPHG